MYEDYTEIEPIRICKKCGKKLPIANFYVIKYGYYMKRIYRRRTCKFCVCNGLRKKYIPVKKRGESSGL